MALTLRISASSIRTISTPRSAPQHPLLPCLQTSTTTFLPRTSRRTWLSASSSPAIEGSWLAKNSRNHKGGAALAAKMSPRAQLVAAEEGLNTWLEKPGQKATSPGTSSRAPGPSIESLRSWNTVPEPAKPSYIVTPRRPSISPFGTRKAEIPTRDDTPGLIAFSVFLLLPIAFQLGRYFEGKDAAITQAAVTNGATTADDECWGERGSGNNILGDVLSGVLSAGGWRSAPVPEPVLAVEEKGWGTWLWDGGEGNEA